MKKNNLVFAIIAIAFVVVSCDRNKVYEEYTEIKDYNWQSKDAVRFEFEIDDTASLHNVYINVRHANMYQFNNLWLFVKSSAPNGQTNVDTVECVLADNSGKWLGDGMGDIWDIQIPWRMGVRFPVKGKYIVEYKQGMRVDVLPGIMDVGLRVEKAEVK
jgi:gliding motility-associated lipoprotein GldH